MREPSLRKFPCLSLVTTDEIDELISNNDVVNYGGNISLLGNISCLQTNGMEFNCFSLHYFLGLACDMGFLYRSRKRL